MKYYSILYEEYVERAISMLSLFPIYSGFYIDVLQLSRYSIGIPDDCLVLVCSSICTAVAAHYRYSVHPSFPATVGDNFEYD